MVHSGVTCMHSFAQVKKLKASLEDARRRMGAQSRTLQQHWRRGITMGDTVRLLSDINSIVDTPQRLQKLEEAKASPALYSFQHIYRQCLQGHERRVRSSSKMKGPA